TAPTKTRASRFFKSTTLKLDSLPDQSVTVTRGRIVTHYNPKVLSELPKLDRAALQSMWKDLFEGPPPPKLRREWLVRILAYRIQERAYGGLKPETQRR